jgi:DNA-binding NtrC family response regulator
MDIGLPPLREREGDVSLLTEYFIDRFNGELGTKVAGVTAGGYRKLNAHSWPGNVRELRNTVERAMLLTDAEVLDAENFKLTDPAGQETAYALPAEGVDFREVERSLVEAALRRTGGNQSRAAALLHMTRDQIRHRMETFSA